MNRHYVLKETNDFYTLSKLLRSSGLGIDIQKENPPGIVTMWRLEEEISGELAGALVMQMRDGVLCLGGIAVAEQFRGDGCGTMLINFLFEQAKARGYDEIWACAKLPDYYKKFGFEAQDWETSPNIAVYCGHCEKYNNSCFPEKVLKKLTVE